MKELVAFAHALSDTTRWRIIELVADEALCVCELADILEMPQSSVSSHLQVIRRAGLLDSERCEKWIYYRLGAEKKDLVLVVREQFAASIDADTAIARDARRAKRRLAEREKSCCPGPRTLAHAGLDHGRKP